MGIFNKLPGFGGGGGGGGLPGPVSRDVYSPWKDFTKKITSGDRMERDEASKLMPDWLRKELDPIIASGPLKKHGITSTGDAWKFSPAMRMGTSLWNKYVAGDDEKFNALPEEQKDAVLEMLRERAIEELGSQEKSLAENIPKQRAISESVLDKELAEMTKELGYEAGVAKQQVGELGAERGLLRSTFTGKQLGKVESGELAAKGELLGQNVQRKMQLREIERKALEDVATQRKALEEQIRSAKSGQALGVSSMKDLEALQQNFDRQINALEIQSANRQQLTSALGTMFANLGFLYGTRSQSPQAGPKDNYGDRNAPQSSQKAGGSYYY